MAESCIFCIIAKGEIPCNKIYEDDKIIGFLDIGPVSKGHALVIPKYHAERLDELSTDLQYALISGVSKISKAIQKALDCDINILNNTGKKAGQLVSHVHFHIIPRRGEKDEFDYNWPVKKYAIGEDKLLLKQIKSKL
jgi:histidine triad (HIT) family protein